MRSRLIEVEINLDQVRANAESIRQHTSRPIIAVVKADGYGLGATHMVDVLAGVVEEFACFTLHEAREIGRPGLLIGPPVGEPSEFRELGVRPCVFTIEDARRFAGMPCAVSVDTGMQRFGCRLSDLDEIYRICRPREAMTHNVGPDSITQLVSLCRHRSDRLHAATTSMLDYPPAWLDAVRPGFALYRGAMRVSTRLYEAYDTHGRVGYTRFEHPHVGIILAGYCNGLLHGPVVINGRRQRLIEIGMNSAFVTTDPGDRAGDEVVLMGDGLSDVELGQHLHMRPHEMLCRFGAMGNRRYVTRDPLLTSDSTCTSRSTAAAPRQT